MHAKHAKIREKIQVAIPTSGVAWPNKLIKRKSTAEGAEGRRGLFGELILLRKTNS